MKSRILSLIVILTLTPLLQSCFLLAGIAALGGGTYYVGTKAGKREDERIKTQALIDVKRELDTKQRQAALQDQSISNQIGQNYLAGQLDSGIAVYPEVRNGVVILHGRVPDAATAERAIAAARKTSGVQRIISNLVIVNQTPQAVPLTAVPQFQNGYYQGQPGQQPPQQRYYLPPQNYQLAPNYPQIQYQQPAPQQPEPQRIQYQPVSPRSEINNPGVISPKESQIVNKQTPKQQKQSPPQASNAGPPGNGSSNQPSQSSPQLLSDKTIDYYSQDNDSAYKEYYPKRVKKIQQVNSPQTPNPIPQQPQANYVPVYAPSYEYDNDFMYREVGSYNPHPISINNYRANIQPIEPSISEQHVPMPVPAPVDDLDKERDYWYGQ